MSDVPPSLAALYANEQAAHGVPDGDRERIRNTVLATVGVTGAAAAATAAGTASAAASTVSGGIVGKLIIVVVALGAIGGGAVLMSRHDSNGVAKRPVTPERRVSREAPPVVTQPIAPVIIEAPAPPPVTPSPLPPSPKRSQASETRVTSTDAVRASESDARRLARAVALNERGDAAEALAVLDGVASTTALDEERDALRIIVLAKLGRSDEACAAVTSFVARFPQSIHRAAVEEVPCSSVH